MKIGRNSKLQKRFAIKYIKLFVFISKVYLHLKTEDRLRL